MCGLAGVFRPGGLAASGDVALTTMRDSLFHRGPDDGDTWTDAPAGIALLHRRLAILDLSPAGRQPMRSASGRYVIVYNGEIYNHNEIRAELGNRSGALAWRGHSDTETLLAGIEAWGIEDTLRKAVGMFAAAIWDTQLRKLTLVRDRMGEKPLFYGWQGDVFLFGSELKALRTHPAFRAEVDRTALGSFLRLGYIAAPHSIYRNVHKLLPGTLIEIDASLPHGSAPQPRAYWSLLEACRAGERQPFDGDDKSAVDELERTLKRAVLDQCISDVPLGAFLSGGIDSTTVVSLLQAQSSQRVRTFTIGFDESDYQEAQHAAAVARVLGTDHAELYVTPRDAMEVIPSLAAMYDEPFGDSSAIPTHLVARFARQHVTVCLSGDGGDELFGGYTRYRSTVDAWSRIGALPDIVRKTLSAGCGAYSRLQRSSTSGWRAERLALYLSAATADECYTAKVLHRPDAHEVVLGSGGPVGLKRLAGALNAELTGASLYDRMMYADSMTYLPDDILTKVDRAAMAVSLETRIPLLDHRVVELAWRLPLHLKVRDDSTKWALKQVLYRHVPEALMQRPKMGFGVPVNEWVKGPLRDWAESLLDEARLRREGFLNPALVRRQWVRHLDGVAAEGDSLWHVLMFQAWLAGTTEARQAPVALAG